jgi:hypothetical protein
MGDPVIDPDCMVCTGEYDWGVDRPALCSTRHLEVYLEVIRARIRRDEERHPRMVSRNWGRDIHDISREIHTRDEVERENREEPNPWQELSANPIQDIADLAENHRLNHEMFVQHGMGEISPYQRNPFGRSVMEYPSQQHRFDDVNQRLSDLATIFATQINARYADAIVGRTPESEEE